MDFKMEINLGTKAETLVNLRNNLLSARIAPLVYFSISDWFEDRQLCVKKIESEFDDNLLIVRSSSKREDSVAGSSAGAFLSLQNIQKDKLEEAIDKVIASYGQSSAEDQVLVQPMLQYVCRSGVAFSHDPNTCAPYRVVNWAEGNNTAVITGLSLIHI